MVKPGFLGPSGQYESPITGTGFYVALSLVVTSYASDAIARYGLRGTAGAYRVGVVAFCLGSWAGIYKAGRPVFTGNHVISETS